MKLSTILTASVLTGTVVVGGSGVAFAAGNDNAGPSASEARADAGDRAPLTKDDCLTALDRRVEILGQANERIDGADKVTEAHRSAMKAINDTAVAGLGSLRAEIEAGTDPDAVKQDCAAVFTEYRVIALRIPQERLVGAVDRIQFAIDNSDARIAKLQAAIDKAASNGKDVTAANASMDALKAKIADASADVDGLADSVLAYAPADWNANHDLLVPARDKVKDAAGDLKAALDDAKSVIRSLRG
ncbi:MAG: hypothetical protein AB7L13_10860 [Acidimicrobiia bacterium]